MGSLISKALPSDGGRSWKVTTKPEIEPVTLSELKEFAHIEYDDEDDLLNGFIESVRAAAEEYLGRALIQQTIKMKMDYWPSIVIKLPRPPLISVTEVVTIDEDDAETTYSSDNYYIATEATPGKLILKKSITAPINTARNYGGFQIEYKAGYGTDESDVPRAIRDGIMLWAAVTQSTRIIDPKNPPPEARSKLDLFRVAGVMIR